MTEKVNYWIELSDYDMETADAMLTSKRFLYVGFMCHQSIEKIFKAYYVDKTNLSPPYSHSLSLLAKKSCIYFVLSESQKELIDQLEPLNIEARYPSYKDKLLKSLTEDKCRNLFIQSYELQQWIRQRLLKK